MGSGLDAPFDVSVPLQGVLKVARGVFARTSDRIERNGCFTEHCRCKFTSDFTAPVPEEVPFTAIYSKRDGIVDWRACIDPLAKAVEVTTSTCSPAWRALKRDRRGISQRSAQVV